MLKYCLIYDSNLNTIKGECTCFTNLYGYNITTCEHTLKETVHPKNYKIIRTYVYQVL